MDGVDLDVAEGEVVGFLGPNGAGKTTTLRMLTTLLRPTAGEATVAGYDVVRQSREVRRRIGYVSQVGSTGSQPSAGEEVVDHAMLYGMSRADATEHAKQLFDELELDGLWERKPSQMSGGQRRRLDVVMGLVHSPSLVFLDEPTTGLDPQARANLWQHIRGLRERKGATVFLTTHYLDEADALSDRIVIIDHGRIVAEDTAENLKRQVSGDLVEVEVVDAARAADAAGVLDRAVRSRASVSGRPAQDVVVDETRLAARIDRAALALPEIVRELDAVGIALASVDVTRPTLDDVFLDLTGRSLRDS